MSSVVDHGGKRLTQGGSTDRCSAPSPTPGAAGGSTPIVMIRLPGWRLWLALRLLDGARLALRRIGPGRTANTLAAWAVALIKPVARAVTR